MRARHYTLVSFGLLFGVSLGTVTCGPPPRNTGPNCTSTCTALGFQQCHEDGTFDPPIACGVDQVCDPNHGCVVCVPDTLYCGGPLANDVFQCNEAGTAGELVESCPMNTVCSGGECKEPCDAADDTPSNLGCDFWAVDLDNEAVNINDAAAQQFAIVVANNNEFPVMVTVTRNAGRVGAPIQQMGVAAVSVPPRAVQRIDLPQREVDGAMGQNAPYVRNSGSGTFVSPHAYHIVTTGPVVVYQFNPIIQQFSNDASTLIPVHALGTDYIAVGFPTANPCGITDLPAQESIPDHGSIAIIAPFDDTHVTVETTHPIMASGGDSGFPIAETPAGGTLQFTTGKFTVVNLETKQPIGSFATCTSGVNAGMNGDMTGTYIRADKPIAVFTGSERGIGFGGADNVQNPPGWDPQQDDICCTDHLEEQLLPVTALGKEFAVARSPIRSTDPTWSEPDIVRVVGSANNTTVTTNLPAPYNQFTLNARQQITFAATTGFTISADKAIQVATYLVSQQFIPMGFIGDPSQLLIPAAEQHRKDYVFLVPATFELNYAVFAKPVAANITLDGVSLDGVEFSSCVRAPIGTIQGVAYEQVSCPLNEGRHTASSDLPFGLSVYGYYNVGSYAYIGGSDIKVINPIF